MLEKLFVSLQALTQDIIFADLSERLALILLNQISLSSFLSESLTDLGIWCIVSSWRWIYWKILSNRKM